MTRNKLAALLAVLCSSAAFAAACGGDNKPSIPAGTGGTDAGGSGGTSQGGTSNGGNAGNGGTTAEGGTGGTGGNGGMTGGTGGDAGAAGDTGMAGAAGDGSDAFMCDGTAAACDSFDNEDDCAAQMGCEVSAGSCGPMVACATRPMEGSCNNQDDCMWDADAEVCVVDPEGPCSLLDDVGCPLEPGCIWSEDFACEGEATSCDALDESECDQQEGCSGL